MKSTFGIIIMAGLMLSSCQSAMKMVCRPGSKSIGCYSFSRGDGDVAFAFGTDKKLSSTKPGQSRSEADCLVTFQSKTDQEVHIFVDTVWMGILDPNTKGYLNVTDDYQYIHAFSSDTKYQWFAEGDCTEKSTFQLQNK